MKKLIVGNWKMQKLFVDIAPYFKVFKHLESSNHYELALAVPAVFIQDCLEEGLHTPFKIGAQNVSEHERGAYTGEISAEQLSSIGAAFSIVGHSERRSFFHESSELVMKKAKRLQDCGLGAIVCIGETMQQKSMTKEVLARQLEGVFSLNPKLLTIAYEPVWAIGTGRSAEADDIEAAHSFIKAFLKEEAYDFSSVRVLYGGSVTANNSASILQLQEVEGLLVGGASLDPVGFKHLIDAVGCR